MAIITKHYRINEEIIKEEGEAIIEITLVGVEKKKRDQIEEIAERLSGLVSEVLTETTSV
jgi:hypothetical protein